MRRRRRLKGASVICCIAGALLWLIGLISAFLLIGEASEASRTIYGSYKTNEASVVLIGLAILIFVISFAFGAMLLGIAEMVNQLETSIDQREDLLRAMGASGPMIRRTINNHNSGQNGNVPAPSNQNYVVCSKCGTRNDRSRAVCNRCGNRL